MGVCGFLGAQRGWLWYPFICWRLRKGSEVSLWGEREEERHQSQRVTQVCSFLSSFASAVYAARCVCLQSSSVESDGLVNTIESVRFESLCLTRLELSHWLIPYEPTLCSLPSSSSSPSTPAANPIWWQCLSNPGKNVFSILAIEKEKKKNTLRLTWTERAERRRSGEKREGWMDREKEASLIEESPLHLHLDMKCEPR